MVEAHKYVVVKEFKGWPKRKDFQIEEHELPPLKDGEILVKSQWLSVDPYMRLHNLEQKYDQFGPNIGVVIETKAADFPIGTKVVSHNGWCDYCILDTNKFYEDPSEKNYKHLSCFHDSQTLWHSMLDIF